MTIKINERWRIQIKERETEFFLTPYVAIIIFLGCYMIRVGWFSSCVTIICSPRDKKEIEKHFINFLKEKEAEYDKKNND